MQIRQMLREKTPHRRVCIFAAWLVILMRLSSWLTDWLLPNISPYLRIFLCSSLPLAVLLLFYGRVRQMKVRSFYRLNPIAPTAVGVWILFGIGANCFATLLNAPIYALLSGYDAFNAVGVAVPESMGEYILGIVFAALLPALLEEMFCRGAVLREYERYGTVFSIFAAASVFALLHMSVASFVFTWVLGLVLAVVVHKTDSLCPAVILHFSANLFSLTRDYLNALMPSGVQPIWEVVQLFVLVIGAFGFVFAFIMLFMLHGKGRRKPRDPNASFGFSFSFLFLIAYYIYSHIQLILEMLR